MAESIEDSPMIVDDEDEVEVQNLISTLDQFNSVIPETVTRYYMRQCALQTDDDRLVKLFSVSVQKFMSEIINDCFKLQKLREKSTNRAAPNVQPTTTTTATTTTTTTTEGATANTDQSINVASSKKPTSTNNTLTINDLTHVLDEYGINVKKTFYYT